jgi:hypothetical protein
MLLKKLIRGVTSDSDLITLADSLGIHIDEILTIDKIRRPLDPSGVLRLDKNRTYLILLRVDQGVGHWVCSNIGFYFDPMGVGPPTVLGLKQYNHKQYQGTYNLYCGCWCLLWLYARQKKRMDLLGPFIDLNNRDFE